MARTRAALRQKRGEGGRFERNYRNVHPCISISSCATPRIFHLDTPTIVLQELRFFRCVVSPHTFRLRNNKIYSNFATQYYYSNTHTHKDAATKSFDNKQKHTLIAPAWRIVLRKHAREHVNTRKLFCCVRKAPEDCFADPRATRSASPLLEPSSRRGSHSVLLLSATAMDERYALHLRSSSFGSNYLNFELVVMRAHLQQHTRMNKHTATSDFCHNR